MTKTIREMVLERPATAAVFEKLHIDYCCGGDRPLDAACEAAGVPVADVLAALDSPEAISDSHDWLTAPLAELIDHIVDFHHQNTREFLARIPQLLHKISSAHGSRHPEVLVIEQRFADIAAELTTHMMKEEMMLFPYIVRMEEAVLAGEPIVPPPFGTVRNPVRMMMMEHDGAGGLLREIREASGNFAVPADGCATFHAAYRALEDFEADLHRHIHLENNILFPRALAMEG